MSGQGVRVPRSTGVRSRCACTMEDRCQVKVCVFHRGQVLGQGRYYTAGYRCQVKAGVYTVDDRCQVKVCVYHGGQVSGQGVRVLWRTCVRSRCACSIEDRCRVKAGVTPQSTGVRSR